MYRMQALAVATLLLLPGCALFLGDGTQGKSLNSTFPWSKQKAREESNDALILQTAKLEASVVSRPANDPKIRRYVWEELDESGLMSPDIRQRLNECGLRVGVAGSTTPWALQSLAREAVTAHRTNDEQTLGQLHNYASVGPAFSLMPNGRSLLEVQSQLEISKLPLNQIAELASVRDRSDLRCVVEVSVKEISDDWVILNFLPQIHAGTATTRLSINGLSDQLPVRQNIVSLYEHQFSVKLLAGEIAVIGRNESSDWNLGRLFFQPTSGSSASERLLIIRMAGIEKLKGRSDPSFRLGSL